jgi:hypothetical protein
MNRCSGAGITGDAGVVVLVVVVVVVPDVPMVVREDSTVKPSPMVEST